MSKSSLRNQKAEMKKEEATTQESTPTGQTASQPTVNPVTLDSQKGKGVSSTRQQKQATSAKKTTVAKKTTASGQKAQTEPKAPAQSDMPPWLEGYLKYQSEFTMQIADQIVEDHRVLTDHEWRLRDVEKRVGLEPQPLEPAKKAKPAEPEAVSQTDPTEPIPKVEPILETVEPEVQEPEVENASEPQSDAIPREMYEARVFENGKWRLRGPYKRISQAEQVAYGDLSKVTIVQVWYDPERDVVLGYLSAEEMDCYFK